MNKKDQQEVPAVSVGSEEPNGWVKLFLKGQPGVLVTLPVRSDSAEQAAVCVRDYLEYFQPYDPQLEPGQHRATIVAVCRRKQVSRQDGAVSIALDLYVDEIITQYKTSTVYLDAGKPARRAAFEKASGLNVDKMPEWDDKPLDWTSNSAGRFLIRPDKPFTLLQKDNPSYNPEKPMEAPKRLPVGFIDPATNGLIDESDVAAEESGTAAPSTKPADDTFAKSRPTPSAKPEAPISATPSGDKKRTFSCNRVSVVMAKVRGKDKLVIRFFSPFDEGSVASAVAFSRQPFREGVGENNTDFFFLNVKGQPYFDQLEKVGDYYPSVLLNVSATQSGGGDSAAWTVETVTLTDKQNAIPGVSVQEVTPDVDF